jgi:hypothetical protein
MQYFRQFVVKSEVKDFILILGSFFIFLELHCSKKKIEFFYRIYRQQFFDKFDKICFDKFDKFFYNDTLYPPCSSAVQQNNSSVILFEQSAAAQPPKIRQFAASLPQAQFASPNFDSWEASEPVLEQPKSTFDRRKLAIQVKYNVSR